MSPPPCTSIWERRNDCYSAAAPQDNDDPKRLDTELNIDAYPEVHEEETTRFVKDSSYYLPWVVFQVERCLFKVPRHYFEKSEVFRGMFALPSGTGDDEDMEGQIDEKPVHLSGIKLRDFRVFLKVLMPLQECGLRSSLETDEWLSVLELAHMWNFQLTRRVAIQELGRRMGDIDVVKKVSLIQKYEIQSWAFAAYEALATRDDSLTVDEMGVLGLVFSSKIAKVREMILKRPRRVVGCFPGHRPCCFCNCARFTDNTVLPSYSKEIHEVFGNPVEIV